MVDYDTIGQSSGEDVPNSLPTTIPNEDVPNSLPTTIFGGRKKMWIIVGVSVLVIVLLVLGVFFVISSLDKEEALEDEEDTAFSDTAFSDTTSDDTTSDDTTSDDTTSDDTTSIDSGDVVSLQDLLDEERDQSEDGLSVELGMTITSLTCSDTSFDIEVTVGALPIEGVIFYFKDGTLNLPYSELRSVPPSGVATFSFDVTGKGLNVPNSIVEVKAFTEDGESGILDSTNC